MSALPTQIAETIQTAHINREPSPRHDLNPSTAASTRTPAYLSPARGTRQRQRRGDDDDGLDGEGDEAEEDDDDDIPLSVLVRPREAPRRGRRRAASFPPMPDLRFEQSYLHSIASADTWSRVAWVTVRDQVLMPLAQGVLYNLAIAGWQHWNRTAQMSGSSAGARLRRWWYGVNNWPLPARARAGATKGS
ncbi:hypothetical protein F4802DRAFT_360339 [Xylaria palmicola]|nr:hypothetical protein F4802DRAFT_360339 [Xylaria palmicola]